MPQSIARPVFQVSVLAIMLFQAAALLARSRLELSLVAGGVQEAVAKDLGYLVVPPILLVLMFPYLRRCRAQLMHLFRPSALTWRLVLLSLVLGLTLRAIRWSVLTLLIRTGVVANEDPNAFVGPLIDFDCPPPSVLALSLGVTALLVPIIEETVSRGFVLHRLLPRGLVLSIGLSALLFALMHPSGTYVSAFIVGILFAVQTLNYGTLWPAAIAHGTYNAAAVIDWECLRFAWNPPPSDPQLAKVSVIAAIIAAVGTCLAIYIVSGKPAGTREASRRT